MNKNADRIYCFTQYWADVYAKYGPFPDIRVLENAVDTTLFTKMDSSARTVIRKALGITPESILIVNANRNSQRKRHDLAIMGFVELLVRNPTKPYYMMIVTGLNPQHGSYYDAGRIYQTELERQGLKKEDYLKCLMLVDTSKTPLSDSEINDIYNASDIGINLSDGEGFGLCQIEHLYTGAPQIVTDIGTYRSFMDDKVCTFIPPVDRTYFAGTMPLGLWAPNFDYKQVADSMTSAISCLPEMKSSAQNFTFKTWDDVCASWIADVKSETQSK
jgi:glycosyltransferase involved in cell wall biosynthesis